MVLPAPPADATPAGPHWLDRLIVAIELAAQGVLTLVDHAAPSRLREAFLRLRARDPATDLIVDARKLTELPPGSTAVLALALPLSNDDLDWLNLNRPVISDRRLNLVLWCEDGAADVLAQRAPDFFDWISARVDCPPAPAAHAVAAVRRAICERAAGIAWDGPGLEETLAAIRPSRPIRRVRVASYQSMIDALTSREPGWLYLDGIDTAFHLRRLRWAMAEVRRRVIVFRRSIEPSAPGWVVVRAKHASIQDAVHTITDAGGTARLAVLAGLDPDACERIASLLNEGIIEDVVHLEDALARAADPAPVFERFRRSQGLRSEVPDSEQIGDSPFELINAPHGSASISEQWLELGTSAMSAGDFEVAVRWLTESLSFLNKDASSEEIAYLKFLRGRSYLGMGELFAARADLENVYELGELSGDVSLMVGSASALAMLIKQQGDPLRARGYLETAVRASAKLPDDTVAMASAMFLAKALQTHGDLEEARRKLEYVNSIIRRSPTLNAKSFEAEVSHELGNVLAEQGDVSSALPYFERSLVLFEQLEGPHHLGLVAVLRDLATARLQLGSPSEARKLLTRALGIQRAALDSDDHPALLNIWLDLASVDLAQGDLARAQVALERVIAVGSRTIGEGPLTGGMARKLLAQVLLARGDLTGAIAQLEQVLESLRTLWQRDDHPTITATLQELERLQQQQRELQRTD